MAQMRKSPQAFRTISEVAETLDIPAHVLRFWESRFPQLRPMKSSGGRRYYRPDDVDLLRGIRELLYDDGMTIKGVQKILREQGQKAVIARGRKDEEDEDLQEDLPTGETSADAASERAATLRDMPVAGTTPGRAGPANAPKPEAKAEAKAEAEAKPEDRPGPSGMEGAENIWDDSDLVDELDTEPAEAAPPPSEPQAAERRTLIADAVRRLGEIRDRILHDLDD